VSVFVYIVTLTTPTEGKSMIDSVARHPRHGSKVIAASAFAAVFSLCAASAQVIELPKSPPVMNKPLSEQRIPIKVPTLALGDLTVTKAEARVYSAAAAGIAPPKVQLRVNYCAKNVGVTAVNGPIRAKFYWSSIGPYSASPAMPGVEGNLFDLTGTLNSGAEHCGKMTLTFASAAALDALGVLKQQPTVGIWAQGKNEGSNPTGQVANNTKPVTLLSAF
jgi:hypothetical protein